jgi:hypothetical protein
LPTRATPVGFDAEEFAALHQAHCAIDTLPAANANDYL